MALVIATRQLVRDAVDRAFLGAGGGARQRLDHFALAFRIGDQFRIKIVGTGGDASRAFAGIDLPV